MIDAMIDVHLRNITELEAKILQTIMDLEEHCRKLPAAQQGTIEETIERLRSALEDRRAFMSDKRKCFWKREPYC
jgi:hypothetical protein